MWSISYGIICYSITLNHLMYSHKWHKFEQFQHHFISVWFNLCENYCTASKIILLLYYKATTELKVYLFTLICLFVCLLIYIYIASYWQTSSEWESVSISYWKRICHILMILFVLAVRKFSGKNAWQNPDAKFSNYVTKSLEDTKKCSGVLGQMIGFTVYQNPCCRC